MPSCIGNVCIYGGIMPEFLREIKLRKCVVDFKGNGVFLLRKYLRYCFMCIKLIYYSVFLALIYKLRFRNLNLYIFGLLENYFERK